MSMNSKVVSITAGLLASTVATNFAGAVENMCTKQIKCSVAAPHAVKRHVVKRQAPRKVVVSPCQVDNLKMNLTMDATPENSVAGHLGRGQSVLEPLSQAMGPGLTTESQAFLEAGRHHDDGFKGIVNAVMNPINPQIQLNSATEGVNANLEIAKDCNGQIAVAYGDMQGVVTRSTNTAIGQGILPIALQAVGEGFGIYFGFRQLGLLGQAVNATINQTYNITGTKANSLFGGGCADIINVGSSTANNSASCNINDVIQNSNAGNNNGLTSTGNTAGANHVTAGGTKVNFNLEYMPKALRTDKLAQVYRMAPQVA